MEDIFKKLDELMTSDLVRKIGGLVCLLIVVILAAAFLFGAGDVINTMKKPIAVEEAPAEEEAEEEAMEEEEITEETEEETDEAAEEETEE
ncbi:MAG: hypothetical protein SCARUB_02713 [Candidatus Scalindua rubra]|uniref:Uncharacterized protein n=1 Tax=Candidatus Scalindua rubra TaxID=1872076 RepID=A0A1E3X974_9BACT|nr:MAG: hypothetical protein SCARUB_02713 [Candidatus Scalindua rubra]